ncbi:MAG: hypothetical protein ACTH54_00930 [Vagococcus salmoninarum]|uniref:hypothetical protein n=1 Tax=Vagococcus salmoninarum TaxID=2739 RepID=UPI003F9C7516
MTLFLITLVATLFLYWLYTYLLQQSKEPSGVVGTMMMKLWNNVYLPMTKWALSLIPPQNYFSILDVGKDFSHYLNTIGFKLLATKEQKQWICYQIIAQ